MINRGEILETIEMIDQQHLDVRTVTMGISLLDCCDSDPKAACRKIYDKITTSAVSYTHLDVYKRQVRVSMLNCSATSMPSSLSMP